MDDLSVARDEQPGGDLVGGVEAKAPSVVRCASSAATLREYADEAARDIADGRLPAPMSVTPLAGDNRGVSDDPLDVAAVGTRSEVDNHRTGRQCRDGLGTHEHRWATAGHLGRGDDDVEARDGFGHGSLLRSALVHGELAGVTTVAAGGYGSALGSAVEECRAGREDLIARSVAHVVTGDDGAEPASGADRLQAGHSGAEHEHFGRTAWFRLRS